MKPGAFALWETPILTLRPADAAALQAPLRQRLTAEAASQPGLEVSNAGGCWHSLPDLALRTAEPFPRLCQAIVDLVREVFDDLAARRGADTRNTAISAGLQAWAMVCPRGGYVTPHDHADASDFSVAWYVDAGDADLTATPTSGRLVFADPRRVPARVGGVELHPQRFEVAPEDGLVVVFPGWVTHWVHPYQGNRPRVVVSANVRLGQ